MSTLAGFFDLGPVSDAQHGYGDGEFDAASVSPAPFGPSTPLSPSLNAGTFPNAAGGGDVSDGVNRDERELRDGAGSRRTRRGGIDANGRPMAGVFAGYSGRGFGATKVAYYAAAPGGFADPAADAGASAAGAADARAGASVFRSLAVGLGVWAFTRILDKLLEG